MNKNYFQTDQEGVITTIVLKELKGRKGYTIAGDMAMFFGERHAQWLVNTETCAIRKLVDRSRLVVGFSDEDFDWDVISKIGYVNRVKSRRIAADYIYSRESTEDYAILKWCIFYEDGYAGMDSDGFGMEEDTLKYIYILIDKDCKALTKWTDYETVHKLFLSLSEKEKS